MELPLSRSQEAGGLRLGEPSAGWVDAKNYLFGTTSKTPGTIRFPCKYREIIGFPMNSKWCEMEFVHPQCDVMSETGIVSLEPTTWG